MTQWTAWYFHGSDNMPSAIISIFADDQAEAKEKIKDELRRDSRNKARWALYKQWERDGFITLPKGTVPGGVMMLAQEVSHDRQR